MYKLNQKGFTLTELIVVVAILGILASIAVPVYRDHIRKANRADAKAGLMANAQYMERYFTTHNTYNDTVTPDPPVLPQTTTQKNTYNLSIQGANATSFTLQAVPAGAQASDACGTFTINHLGAKTPTTGNCW